MGNIMDSRGSLIQLIFPKHTENKYAKTRLAVPTCQKSMEKGFVPDFGAIVTSHLPIQAFVASR